MRKERSLAEVSKNLVRYRSENNFVWIKIIMQNVQTGC